MRNGHLVVWVLAIAMPTGMLASGGVAQSQDSATFEVASVKPGTPGFTGGPRVPDGDGTASFPACAGGLIQVDPQRFSATNTTLYTLITLAYGIRYSCFIVNDADLLSGGPKWILSDRFDVQGVIPAGSPSYTFPQLQSGSAPALQAMLRNLLTERFKLAVHPTTKDMRAYVLTALPGAEAKLPQSRPEGPKGIGLGIEPDENKEFIVHVRGNKASIAEFAHVIEPVTHTPVLDHTGLAGEYSFDLKFAVIEPFSGPLANLVGATSPTIFTVLQQQGLRLERMTAPVDAWVIDRAEKPSEN
jgi:uncharacterized protein (TIGR03435 family)